MKFVSALAFCLLLVYGSPAQEITDTSFSFPIHQAAYQRGTGPLVLIDQAHNNFHTRNGRFSAFSKLLEQDGYVVQALLSLILDTGILKDCRILVIANALHPSNIGKWVLPTPSAFTKEEIDIIKGWVRSGGTLLLIADHMPFAGAAFKLGKAFGFEYINGFAFFNQQTWPPMVFIADSLTLPLSPIAKGNHDYERVDRVATFTGSAFYAPDVATPVLSFLDGVTYQPDTAWKFRSWTPWENLERYHQGAIRKYGHGRVAVFGEAAMFTAQIVFDTIAVGFNSEYAPRNAQFTLNLIHWLDGVTEYQGEVKGEK